MTLAPQNKKPNIFLLFVIVGLVAAAILFSMYAKSLGDGSKGIIDVFASKKVSVDLSGQGVAGVPRLSGADHVRGAQNASVILIEYGDFECPYCKKFDPVLKQVLQTYPNDVQVVFRHFPLTIHQYAYEKAIASECAAALGGEVAFWKYHDLLYDRSDASGQGIGIDDLPKLAAEIGINASDFEACEMSGKYDARVQSDLSTGAAAGITGTPSTVIVAPDGSGTLVPGALDFTQLQQVLDYLLNDYVSG